MKFIDVYPLKRSVEPLSPENYFSEAINRRFHSCSVEHFNTQVLLAGRRICLFTLMVEVLRLFLPL